MYEIDKLSYLQIGVQGDNESTDIVIDVTAWAEKYPEAEFFIVFKPYNAQEISPMDTRYEDGILTWTVNSAATAVTGVGYTEIRAQDSHGLIKKSRIIPTAVENSVSGVDDTPPAAYQEWVTAVLNAGATAKNAAAAAMAVSEGREIRFEIGTDDSPTGTSGHLLFYYMDDDDEWAYLDLGAVDAYGLAKAGGYTGTKTAFQTDMGNSGTNATAAANNAETAEAFAIGKRNGEDVTSGDAAYHNNSKYWSGIAEAAAATASAAYGTDLLAPAYTSLSFPVKKGDHCIYSGGYYEAKQDIAESEAWTAAHWTQVTVGGESSGLKGAITLTENVSDISLTWENGAIDSTNGHATSGSSPTRCRIGYKQSTSGQFRISAPSGYKYVVFIYTSASQNTYVGRYIDAWCTGSMDLFVTKGNWIRVVGAFSDDATIAPTDMTGFTLKTVSYTDKALTTAEKAADAKATGDRMVVVEEDSHKSMIGLMALCPNLFSEKSADYVSGKGYSGTTGDIVTAAANCVSGYVKVNAGDYLQVFANGKNIFCQRVDSNPRKVGYYDSSKVWSKTTSHQMSADDPTKPDAVRIASNGYIRVMFRKTDDKVIKVSSVREDRVVDLIIFAGQSNMAGRGETSEDFPQTAPAVTPGAGYEFKTKTDPTQLYAITEPFGYAENAADDESGIYDGTRKTGDMVPAFVNAYYANNGHVPVVGVSASEGGSSSVEWQPTTGNNFVDLAARVALARTWLVDNGYSIRHQYCLWCQGESDGDNINSGTETLDEYKTRARAIFTGLIDLGLEKVLLVRIGNCNASSTSTRYKAIINWQTEEAKTNENIVLVSTDFAAMRAEGMMKDSFHYYQVGYNITGNSAGLNSAYYAMTGKEPTMYDPENDNLYYSHKP